MKKITVIATTITLLFTAPTFGQGCETLLMNGVFDTFNYNSGNYSSAQWHNSWCNGKVEQVSSSSSSGATLNLGVAKISLGMSYDDAKEFQKVYKSLYCGSNSYSGTSVSSNSVIQKVASPDILDAYVKCKEIENGGLKVNLSLRPQDNKVFVVDVKYTKAWGTPEGPKLRKVRFVPNVISVKEGTLQDDIGLKTGITYSLVCERSTDVPITIYIETEVGTYSANLPAFIPPPTEQERVMNAIPRGTILGWFDPIRIPKGWVICDGNNGTPNLNERFPLGTATGKLGEMPGASSVTPKGTADLNHKEGAIAWDINPRQHEDGMAVAYNRGASNNIPLNINAIDIIPPATKIIFIMKI